MRPSHPRAAGHLRIVAWPGSPAPPTRRTSPARDALAQQLRDYQDWTGVNVVVVFDGRGTIVSHEGHANEIQIFYSRDGQTADSIIERLASKYAERFELLVATGDYLEQETVSAFGAETISPDGLRDLLRDARGF